MAENRRNRGRRRIGLNLLLAACAVVVGLLLAELVLRLCGIGRAPAIALQGSTDFYIRSAIEGLNYEIRPGFVGRAYGCDVRINSHGMRSPERPLRKPQGARRVLVLGDSVAFGHGVEQSAIFPAVLETMLCARTSEGLRVEVLNAAVPGYNAAQERIFLRAKGLAWQPDLVLAVAVVNDAEPAYQLHENGGLRWEDTPEVYREAFERYFMARGVGGFLRRHVRVVAVIDGAFRRPYFLTRQYMDYLDGLYGSDAAGWRTVREALLAMREMCRARDIGFVVAYCAIPAQPEPETLARIRRDFADFAQREHMAFVGLAAVQNSRPVRQVTLSTADRHPNALGHRLLAEALLPTVARELAHARPAYP